MMEEEWFSCQNPELLLFFLQTSINERQGRLFAVACLRRIWDLMTDKRSRHLTEVVERHIEGLATDDEWAAATTSANQAWADTGHLLSPTLYGLPEQPLTASTRDGIEVLHSTTSAAHNLGYNVLRAIPGHEGRLIAGTVALEAARARNQDYRNSPERPYQAELVREIVGNPFRPVELDQSWLTSDVLLLARGIYEEQAFDRMPILADALQDAGCDNTDVLNHCRDVSQIHVRGCWVVDLLLDNT